jgi:hypothetical protein
LPPHYVDQVVRDGKIEGVLFRLDLVPGHWHQQSVEMHTRKHQQNDVCLCRSPCRRVADFAPRIRIGLPRTMSCWALPAVRITVRSSPLAMDNKAAKQKNGAADDNKSFTATSFATGMKDNRAPTPCCGHGAPATGGMRNQKRLAITNPGSSFSIGPEIIGFGMSQKCPLEENTCASIPYQVLICFASHF